MNSNSTHAPVSSGNIRAILPTLTAIERRRARLGSVSSETPTSAAPTTTPIADEQPSTPGNQGSAPPARMPTLPQAALHGTAGDVLRILAPHTEAHPAALLLQLLTAFGSLVGRGPHCEVESTRHGLNLFTILVGDSSKARKGTSWNHIARLFALIDPLWLEDRVQTARMTPNSIVRTLRNTQPRTDQRLLLLSEEFAPVLAGFRRGNSPLSPLLRCAWDNGDLPTADSKHRTTGAHISLIAHITEHELTSSFAHAQAHNGFANRCLWIAVERSNCLPEPGRPDAVALTTATDALRDAVAWATARPEILFTRDPQAAALWADCYPDLSHHLPGLRGAATSRGEAQVLRLSAIYAALDRTERVALPHLQAALAIWNYCCDSATRLFGTSTGNAIADRIRDAVEASPEGLTRSQIRGLFSGHVDRDRIDAALQQLTALGAFANHSSATRGRPTVRWSTR